MTDATDHPARKDGRTFKGVCELCDEPIYSGYDHDERCIYVTK